MKAFRILIFCSGFGVPADAFADPPIGVLDGVNEKGVVVGWGLDPDTAAQPIVINFYIDAPPGQGKFLGATIANISRPDVNRARGVPGDHGFSWPLPAEYARTPHQLYAYAVDSSGNGSTLNLSGSPFPLTGRNVGRESAILGSFNVNPSDMPGAKSISGKFRNSTITITTADAFAGAIFSLTWNGKQFINNEDHGRELQSSAAFDGNGECFNPTEAGSSDDLQNSMSTSRTLSLSALENVLRTRTQMAFWLKPVERSAGCGTALNRTALSSHFLDKTVTIGFQGLQNVIEHKVTFHVAEPHSSAAFEALTGYMPASFSKFWTYDPLTRELAPLADGPGYQRLPVILATIDGSYAMGVYSPDEPQVGTVEYGRWRFDSTTKWNCIFRETNITVRDYPYRCYSIVGTLSDVTDATYKLYSYFKRIPATEVP
jgi:hypothetical protein